MTQPVKKARKIEHSESVLEKLTESAEYVQCAQTNAQNDVVSTSQDQPIWLSEKSNFIFGSDEKDPQFIEKPKIMR